MKYFKRDENIIGNKCKQECLWLKSMRFSNKLHFCFFLLIFIPEEIFLTENQNSPRHIFAKATRNCDRFHCLEVFFTIKNSPSPPPKNLQLKKQIILIFISYNKLAKDLLIRG